VEPGHKLPQGWRWVRLGEVGHFISGGTPSKENPAFWNGNIPFITGADVTDFYVSSKGARAFLTSEGLSSGKTALCHPGTILFVTRTRVGRVGIATELMGVSQDLSPYICGPELFPEFVCRYLLSLADYLITNCRGATIQGLKRDFIHGLRIPLPPLPEQQRIVALLNGQMATVERARVAAQAQLEAAKVLPAAYLRAVFNSPEAQTWPTAKIGEVAKVQSGYAFKSEWFAVDGIRLLRNANVSHGFIRWDDAVFLPSDRRHEFKNYELNEGDIVLSLDRPLVSNGLKVARISEGDLPALLLQRVGRFYLSDSIEPDYLYSLINSEKFIAAITGHDQSLGVPQISPKQVESIEIPLPSTSKQQFIVSMLGGQISEANRLSESLEIQLNNINALPAALLRRAFNGEL
jgi:type I restriction enzyme, S subunit